MGTIQLNKNFFIKIGIGLLSFAIFLFFGSFISEAGNCWGGLSADCWSRWDSALYLDVAQNGHNLFPCKDYPSSWCGNAGWAPAYPFAIRFLHWILPNTDMANIGLYLSLFFVLLTIWFIGFWQPQLNYFQYFIATLIYQFASGSIYLHAIFPLSMLLFFIFLLFYFLDKSQFFWAGIFAFFAVLTYSIGFVLILCLGAWILYDFFMKDQRKIKWNKVFVLVGASLGLITWFVYDYVKTGHWDALFLIQFKYGHDFNVPWKHMGTRFQDLMRNWGKREMWIEIQNFLLWGLVLTSCVYLSLNKNRRPNWIFYSMFCFLFLAVPYSTSAITAIFRNAIVLSPIWVYLSTQLKWEISIILLIIFVLLSYPMGILFIQSVLV